MKPNKTYVAPDGYEYFMCPMTTFKITQTENVGTHLGTKAVDFASETPGKRDAYYAPATSKCIRTIPSHGEATWQTVGPVHSPNGYFGVITYETVHDNSFNAKPGMIIKQGQQLGNMGDAGKASGVHLHMEGTQSANSNMAYNKYGVYTYTAPETYLDDLFYVDDTNILTPMQGNWRKTGNSTSSNTGPSSSDWKSKLIQEDGKATFTVDDVRERKNGPTGEVMRTFKTGDSVVYQYKYVGNGHRYVVRKEGNDYYFIAVSGSEEYGKDKWANCGPVDQVSPDQPKPEEPKPEDPKYDAHVKSWGCDISEHNPNFDVKGQGFVIIRATYGTNMDKLFEQNVKKCQDANVPFGVYCYSYALDDSQALEEAQYILEAIKDIELPLGVWYDMEDADQYKEKNGALNQRNCTKFCEIFCDYVKSKGYYTGIYSTPNWFNTLVLTGNKYNKWYAHWLTNNGTLQADYYGKCVLYQYTANPYDKNVCYVDFSEMKSNPIKDPVEDPKPDIPQFPDQGQIKDLMEEQKKFYQNWNMMFDKLFG